MQGQFTNCPCLWQLLFRQLKMLHFLCFYKWKSFVNKVSRHSSRPYFSFKAKRKIWKKEKAFRLTKCFFLLDAPAHWNAKDAKRLVAFPGVCIQRLAGHFVRAFNPATTLRNRRSNKAFPEKEFHTRRVLSDVWNSREMAPWERNTITPGCPFFGSLRKAELRLLWASKEMNSYYVSLASITLLKLCRCLMLHISPL